ncbi:MAG: RNA-binding S4 domain-containing protein [Bacteroidetes bacterium]|nr:RNA-binding S4 domain-containing protein [Bacteroidota bacterium]
MPEKEKLRIDKYLWAIRMFKTRTLATEACKAGKIKLEGQNIKPSHEVKVGELYVVSRGIERKVIRVTGLLENRMDAKSVVNFFVDETPEEQTIQFKTLFHAPVLKRERGAGRPTKRERRDIDELRTGFFKGDE